ncbi:MAG: trypsin-like peptidase domain-containing protein [Phenylobacterium sp.]|nr:trypsin-like peptidase domain-containing protein [Phenylobacterium sp.]
MNLLPTAPDQPCGRRAPAASPPMRPSWLGAFLAIATFSLAGPVIAAELPDLSVFSKPPPAAVVDRPLEADRPSQTLGLARISSSIRHGASYALVLWGKKCAPDSLVTWDEANDAFEKTEVDDRIFHETLTGLGFRVAGDPTDLFRDAEAPAGDLQVGGLITDYSFSACGGFMPGEQKLDMETAIGTGVGQMTVEWQIYVPALSRTIARIRTTVRVETATPVINVPEAIHQALMRDSLRALAADDGFRKAVTTPIRAASGLVEPQPGEPLRLTSGKTLASVPEAHQAVAAVVTGASLGTAFLVSEQGYLLTNRHVVGSTRLLKLRWSDGSESIGEVIRSDAGRDVALIRTDPRTGPVLRLRSEPVRQGETVFAIGTPMETRLQGTLTRGVISASRTLAGYRFIQSDTAVNPGNSGGPLLDESGRVVAVTVSRYASEPADRTQGLNFFIPIDDALSFLALTFEPR